MNTNKQPKRIVIWGLRKRYHTHRHIHQAFYTNAKKLGYDAIWVEDEAVSSKLIKPGDLIIAAEPVGRMVPEKTKIDDYYLPIRTDVFYCLHKYKPLFVDKLEANGCNYINLDVYLSCFESEADIRIGPVTFFNTKTKTLYQPWATNLLAHEFKEPLFKKNKLVFWVGSIWNDKDGHGNINEINVLKNTLHEEGLRFIHVRFIPDWLNTFLIRCSRIAPAISGRWQAENNYLPDRVFKNVSYGQLAITNVKKFKDIFGKDFLSGDTIEQLIKNALALKKDDYLTLVRAQQEKVKNYTYKESFENIIGAFNL